MGVDNSSETEAFITHPPPPLPYVKGRHFIVRSHNPLPPERHKSRCCALKGEARVERLKVSPLERCLRHPPPEGSYNDFDVEFEIVDELRAGLYHRTQILTVKILQSLLELLEKFGSITTVVAKFYDPLYYDHEEGDGDPFHCVNHHYTHEVASYHRLVELQGTIVPIFYGSYSLEIPVDRPSATTRSVRLILMERINGPSMRELKPEDFTQLEQQRIMKLVIDGEAAIHTRDIMLSDLHPRNVLVDKGEGSQRNIGRVVHVDFGGNMMSRFWWVGYGPEKEKARLPGVFISPLIRWHPEFGMPSSFHEWIDWDYQRWLEDEYAYTLSTVTPQVISAYLPQPDRRGFDARTLEMFGIEATSQK